MTNHRPRCAQGTRRYLDYSGRFCGFLPRRATGFTDEGEIQHEGAVNLSSPILPHRCRKILRNFGIWAPVGASSLLHFCRVCGQLRDRVMLKFEGIHSWGSEVGCNVRVRFSPNFQCRLAAKLPRRVKKV